MGDTLSRLVTWREAQDAAGVLREEAAKAMRESDDGFRLHGFLSPPNNAARARAEALRRVAEWIEQEAARDG